MQPSYPKYKRSGRTNPCLHGAQLTAGMSILLKESQGEAWNAEGMEYHDHVQADVEREAIPKTTNKQIQSVIGKKRRRKKLYHPGIVHCYEE